MSSGLPQFSSTSGIIEMTFRKTLFALSATAGVGIGLIALAFLAEGPGRAHTVIVIVRNSLITFVALALLLATLLIIVGPMH